MDASDRLVSMAAAALAALFGGGCSGAPSAEHLTQAAGADTALNGDELNGVSFNGVSFNGVSFNGVSFNGVSFNGVSFNGVQLDPLPVSGLSLGGQPLTGVTLQGSSLSGILSGGVVSGGGLVGAQLAGTLSNGAAVVLRIDGVTAGASPDVQRYRVSARLGPGGPFSPLCGTASDGTAVAAIPLSGGWDLSQGTATGGAHVDDPASFTFACEGYALAKCVELGYAPWRSVTECKAPDDCAVRSLVSFHQACTRMLRADYCGDGTPTTRDGTHVDVWDDFGIQGDAEPSWNLEAEWGSGGAVCVDRTRWATRSDGEDVATYIHDHCPDRWQAAGCGGQGSTFFTPAGFDVPLGARALLRTRLASP
jgi:hypothetical protein